MVGQFQLRGSWSNPLELLMSTGRRAEVRAEGLPPLSQIHMCTQVIISPAHLTTPSLLLYRSV